MAWDPTDFDQMCLDAMEWDQTYLDPIDVDAMDLDPLHLGPVALSSIYPIDLNQIGLGPDRCWPD